MVDGQEIREQGFGFRVGNKPGADKADQGQAMGQQLQPWRSENGQTRWLSMLIDAMEKVSSPEFRAVPCDLSVLAAVRAQLARPASPYVLGGSRFSLRN